MEWSKRTFIHSSGNSGGSGGIVWRKEVYEIHVNSCSGDWSASRQEKTE